MQCHPGTVGWAECGNAVAGGGAVRRSFGKAGLAVLLLGRGWKPVQLVGCVVVLPESLQRGLLVPTLYMVELNSTHSTGSYMESSVECI